MGSISQSGFVPGPFFIPGLGPGRGVAQPLPTSSVHTSVPMLSLGAWVGLGPARAHVPTLASHSRGHWEPRIHTRA